MLAHAPAKCHNVVHKTDSRSREIVFFVFFLSLATFRPEDTAAGDNAKEHNLLCRLTQMAGRKLAIPELDTSASSVQATMNEINVSTSEPEWTSLFKVEDEAKRSPEFPTDGTAAQNRADWEARWPAWYAAAAAAHDRLKKAPKPNPYPAIGDAGQKQALHTIAEQLSAVAEDLHAQALLLQTKVQETDKTAATAAITSAVFGEATSADDLAAGKLLGAANNRAAACAADKVGKSILGDFYCLCTGTGSGDTECGSGYSSTNGGEITFGKTELTGLTDTCPKANDAPISAQEISSAIAEFSATLTRNAAADDAKVTLGKTTNHGCGGGAGEICVTYEYHFTKKNQTRHRSHSVGNPVAKCAEEAARNGQSRK